MTRVDSFLRNAACDVMTNLRLLHIEAEEQILVSQVEFAIGNDWMGPDLSRWVRPQLDVAKCNDRKMLSI